ncbi:MAG: CHASE2 domain-containing protein [Anaerolineales bacterium]
MNNRFRLFFIAAIALATIPTLALTRVFEAPELRTIDIAFQLRGPRPAPDEIVIVAIDDESFQQTGLQWPWPRSYLAEIIRGISAGDPAVIVVDVFFFEPGSDEGGDAQLAAAIAEAGNVLLANQMLFVEQRAGNTVFQLEQLETPIPELTAAAHQLGLANFSFDADGVVRRGVFSLTRRVTPAPLFHWAVIAAAEYLGAPLPESYAADHATLGARDVPLSSGTIEINYVGGPGTYQRVPAYQIPNGDREPSIFKGKIVLLGATSVSLHDVYPTPFSTTVHMPGVEIMANAIQTLIDGDFIVRWSRVAAAGIALLLALVAYGLSRADRLFVGLGVVLGVMAAYVVAWIAAFVSLNLEIPLTAPLVAVAVGFAVPSVDRAITEELERRKIRDAFSHYVSAELVEQLSRDPSKLVLGGERREMTFLFTDIRGFTTISERLDPAELTHLLNRFLTPMTELIMQHRGTIDKYMGDAIMAFWNAPIDDPDHARHACSTALDMRVELVDLNNQLLVDARAAGRAHAPIRIGVGVNTGWCSVGNFGSDQRFDYSVIGDDVNLASRLEGQSKTYGVDIVIGESTQEYVPDFAALELDLIQVKGKTQPVRVYALEGDEVLKSRPEFQTLEKAHAKMLATYRAQDWTRTRELLEACRAANVLGLDLSALYELYRSRVDQYEANPPGPDWDGVYVATTK